MDTMAEGKPACDICGETEFNVKEGFYYCTECGTQSQHVRDFVIDQEDIEESKTYFTSIKTKKETKKNKKGIIKTYILDELTTWECFNYFLRSLVDEFLKIGAKDSLKLTVLQLWTAYLRRNEVAFFSKNSVELPRLGPKYDERDARILYNHVKIKKRHVRMRNEISGKNKTGIQKRKYAQAEYETLSQPSLSSSAQGTSETSQSSLASNQAIKLNLSRCARKYYKRYMQTKHLNKHETDSNYKMQCHTLHSSKFSGGKKPFEGVISRKIMYSIVYLALNLIEDDIQLCDLLRFCREGHLSMTKLSYAFCTEEVANNCNEVLTTKNHGWAFFLNRSIRESAAHIARLIHIKDLKTPNLVDLAKRFVADLRLPAEVGTFVERLYNLNPPKMKFNFFSAARCPCYEGRAMGYVIFVLKLLFIIDGETELHISNSAKTINAELRRLGHKDKQIFVWEEWVQYIEMRKVILTQCHYPTSVHLGENVNNDDCTDNLRQTYQTSYDDVVKSKRHSLLTMGTIFGDLHKKLLGEQRQERIPTAKFTASLRPYSTYLKEILSDVKYADKLYIPDFMRDDPAEYDIKPFIHAKQLKNLFRENNVKLAVKKVGCMKSRQNIGVYYSYPYAARRRLANAGQFRIVDYDINEDDWIRNLKEKAALPDIFSKTANTFKSPARPNSAHTRRVNLREVLLNNSRKVTIGDASSVHSFDVFSEDNMEPLPISFIGDRPRQMEPERVLMNISDDEEDGSTHPNTENWSERAIELKVSSFDCWNLFGVQTNICITEIQKVDRKCPQIFRWLLETCAQVIEVEKIDLYEELLAIENQFMYALEPLDNFQGVLSYRKALVKDQISKIINSYRNTW